MKFGNQNPHNIPPEKVVWLSTVRPWENPLKVFVGPSTMLQTEDGRPFVMIAELYAPTKCTYHCHPDNFSPMVSLAKRLAMGELALGEELP